MTKPRIIIEENDASLPLLPVPLCFTEQALAEIAATVGSKSPETGATLFGPFDRFGIDTVEFDAHGSKRSSSSIYAPDHEWAETRRKYWLDQDPPKLLHGVVHSHPGDFGRPSEAAGEAIGDLGFVAAVFAANEVLQYFALPIVTRTVSGEARLHPWVAARTSEGGVALFRANIQICASDDFPNAVYNPAWEFTFGSDARAMRQESVSSKSIALDVPRIAHLIEGDARIATSESHSELVALRHGVILKLVLPPDFPDSGPRVLLPSLDTSVLVAPQNWRRKGKGSPEERLAKLIKETVKWLARAS